MKDFFKKVERIFYWILGAAVYSGGIIIVWGLSLGIVALFVEYSCKIIECSYGAKWLLDTPVGMLMGIGIITGLYLQSRWPVDLLRDKN